MSAGALPGPPGCPIHGVRPSGRHGWVTTNEPPRRTKGSGFTLTRRYLVDMGGDQVTELDGTGTWQHSNIWAGGKLVATYDSKGIHFALSDPLGTKRVPGARPLTGRRSVESHDSDPATSTHLPRRKISPANFADHFPSIPHNGIAAGETTPPLPLRTGFRPVTTPASS
jgi:hypothetical protein